MKFSLGDFSALGGYNNRGAAWIMNFSNPMGPSAHPFIHGGHIIIVYMVHQRSGGPGRARPSVSKLIRNYGITMCALHMQTQCIYAYFVN